MNNYWLITVTTRPIMGYTLWLLQEYNGTMFTSIHFVNWSYHRTVYFYYSISSRHCLFFVYCFANSVNDIDLDTRYTSIVCFPWYFGNVTFTIMINRGIRPLYIKHKDIKDLHTNVYLLLCAKRLFNSFVMIL